MLGVGCQRGVLAPASAVASGGASRRGCVCAASPDASARLAANQQSADDAVHIYTSMANCYRFYHINADLIFPTGLVEVVSRAQSSKTVLSELFRFFLKLVRQWKQYICFPWQQSCTEFLLIHLPKKTGHTESKWFIQVLIQGPLKMFLSGFAYSPLNAEIYVWIDFRLKKKKALKLLLYIWDCNYSNNFPPFLRLGSFILPLLLSISWLKFLTTLLHLLFFSFYWYS